MPLAGPVYFAWVDGGTAFDPTIHNRMDEYMEYYNLVLSEGDMPALELRIRNPHIGLLNSSRKQWAWLSRMNSVGTIVPMFYGRIVAAPRDIFKEVMTIELIAWPSDFYVQKQALAEQIKLTGPYDPVFIDVSKRDDPDTMLEAISGRFHVDPVTHVVSISDLLNGEDGNVDITADQHFYEKMNADLDQTSALTNILMDATVTWNQTGQGYIDMGNRSIGSFAGDAIINEWPKPLQSLGGGYTVAYSNAVDAAGINAIVTATATYSWTNQAKEHSDGDQLSLNWSVTAPAGYGTSFFNAATVLTETNQSGALDPFAVDGDGDPAPVNIPAHFDATYAYVPWWRVNTSLVLLYRDLQRQRTERVQMLLTSDLQTIIVDPTVEQSSEVITKSGADVGIPIVPLLSATTVAGQTVGLDTIVFPDHPSLPSQRTAQICTTAGLTTANVPDFSDIPGTTTTWGTAVFASLGISSPTETAYDWTALTNVGLGTVILARKPLFIAWTTLTQAGRQLVPQTGTQASLGMIIQSSNGFFHVCTLAGLTLTREPNFANVRGTVTNDGSAQWTCLGAALPDGKTHFLCVQPGKTGAQYLIPAFDNTLHAQTTDGTVVWAAIGTGVIPIGGTPGDTWASSFFDSDYAKQYTFPYLISIQRAHGRKKARAVAIDFSPIDPFGLGLELTLRKTVSLHDTRLGGGIASGKLIRIEHACDGPSGRETCNARIGCAIGNDTTITAVHGNPTWCAADFLGSDYQVFSSSIVVIGDASDVGYTPPVAAPNDDGLVFPLTKDQIVISEAVRGDAGAQGAAVGSALNAMAQAARLGALQTSDLGTSAMIQKQIQALQANSVQRATTLNPIWYDAVLKPLSGLEFNAFYNVKLTQLTCPKGIDLQAASTP
ncbi:hypothetical protein ACE10Z_23680 [Bradyrhizobium sp. Pha-3]|uniref:hypothetical protein n=1 Tax=Bradyrhizobium sp. Pha-3 TaxID=208375 RepID=UPI0035D4190A